MADMDIIDDIISRIDPEDVPVEYIIMAKVKDFDGNERVLKGSELEEMFRHPENFQVMEARLVLNVRKMRKAIMEEINYVYDEVNRIMNAYKKDDKD